MAATAIHLSRKLRLIPDVEEAVRSIRWRAPGLMLFSPPQAFARSFQALKATVSLVLCLIFLSEFNY